MMPAVPTTAKTLRVSNMPKKTSDSPTKPLSPGKPTLDRQTNTMQNVMIFSFEPSPL